MQDNELRMEYEATVIAEHVAFNEFKELARLGDAEAAEEARQTWSEIYSRLGEIRAATSLISN